MLGYSPDLIYIHPVILDNYVDFPYSVLVLNRCHEKIHQS